MKLIKLEPHGLPCTPVPPTLSSVLAQPYVFVRFIKVRYVCMLLLREAPAPLTNPNPKLYELQALQNLELPLGAAMVIADGNGGLPCTLCA